MAEWHLPPDYIMANWTDELLNLMVEKLAERKERENTPWPSASSPGDRGGALIPDSLLLAKAANLIKVVRK